jgi:hypothetical protein
MSNHPWTPDELRLLAEYHRQGLPIAAVTAATGRSAEAVSTKAKAMHLRWRGRAERLARAGTLENEIEAAKREAATAPLFRPGDRI